MGNPVNIKRLTINLEDYILDIAEEKAKIMFKGKIDDYIHWLICNNNKYEVKKKIKEIEKLLEEQKLTAIPETYKTAMYNNICEYCGEAINQGDEICRAEGYKNYIHKKHCKKDNG